MITFYEYLIFEAGDPNDHFTPAWYWKHIRRLFKMNYQFKPSIAPYIYVVIDEDKEIGYVEKGDGWYHFVVYTHSFSHQVWKDIMSDDEIRKNFKIFNEFIPKDVGKMIHVYQQTPMESRKT